MILALLLACGQLECQPLASVPIDDGGLLDSTDELREQLVLAGGWFQVEPCVAEVQVVEDVTCGDDARTAGMYEAKPGRISVEPDAGQDLITHELCHAIDHDLHDADGWWFSDQHAAAFDEVELVGCPACDSFDARVNETFAQYCQPGPLGVRLARAVAERCPELGGPTAVDELIAERIYLVDDLDPPAVPLDEGLQGQRIETQAQPIDGITGLRAGPDALYAVVWLPGSLEQWGPESWLARIDPGSGLAELQRPWQGMLHVDQVDLSGGDPVVAWASSGGQLLRAWVVGDGGEVQQLELPGGDFAAAAASAGRVLLLTRDEGLLLWELDPATGELLPRELPPELPPDAHLVGLTPTDQGWLLAVRDQRRGLALWLDQDLAVTRTAGFPGAWPTSRVHALDDGLVLRWELSAGSRLVESDTDVAGYARWSPGQDWQVGMVGCTEQLGGLAVYGGELYGQWRVPDSEGRWLGRVP